MGCIFNLQMHHWGHGDWIPFLTVNLRTHVPPFSWLGFWWDGRGRGWRGCTESQEALWIWNKNQKPRERGVSCSHRPLPGSVDLTLPHPWTQTCGSQNCTCGNCSWCCLLEKPQDINIITSHHQGKMVTFTYQVALWCISNHRCFSVWSLSYVFGIFFSSVPGVITPHTGTHRHTHTF